MQPAKNCVSSSLYNFFGQRSTHQPINHPLAPTHFYRLDLKGKGTKSEEEEGKFFHFVDLSSNMYNLLLDFRSKILYKEIYIKFIFTFIQIKLFKHYKLYLQAPSSS